LAPIYNSQIQMTPEKGVDRVFLSSTLYVIDMKMTIALDEKRFA